MGLTRPRYSNIVDTDYKQSCRTVTTTNITLTGGAPNTYDGLTLAVGDRVLVNAQSTGSQNGIYVVYTLGSGSNGTWIRSPDSATSDRVTGGMSTIVTEGTYAGTPYRLVQADPIVLDTTSLSFASTAATVSGTSRSVQYNNAGFIAGAASLVYDNATGNVVAAAATASTTTTTGALVVKGGVGIAGDINVGGIAKFNSNVVIVGNLTTLGNTFITNSTDLSIQDSIINLHTPTDLTPLLSNDGKDIGLKFHYYDTADSAAFVGRANDTGYLEWYDKGSDTGGVFSGTSYGTIKTGNIVLVGNLYRGSGTIGTSVQTHAIAYTTTSATPPSNPQVGDQWYDTSTDTLYEWFTDGASSYWVDLLSKPVAINFATQSTPPIGGKPGDYWYDTSTDTLYTYVYDGVGAYWVDFSSKQPAPASTTTSSTAGTVNLSTSVSGVLGVPNGGTGSVNFTSGSILVGASTSAITASTLKFDSLTGNLVIPATTTSTNTTTGALVVAGGIGVVGNVYVGGNIAIDGGQMTLYDSIIDLHTYGNLSPWTSDDGKDIGIRMHYFNGADKLAFMGLENSTKTLQFLVDATEVSSNVAGTFGNVQLGSLLLSNTTTSTSTTTGALIVAGGAGIAGNVNIGGNVQVSGAFIGNVTLGTVPSSPNNLYGVAPLNLVNSQASTLKTQLNLINTGGSGGAGSAIDFYTYTDQGNRLPGARFGAIDDGNYGATFQWFIKADGNTGNNSLQSVLSINQLGNVVVPGTTTSTSTTTGALVVAGGVGIAGNVNIGGTANLFIGGNQTTNGPAFSAYANTTLQTITSGSQQKVLFQVEEYDTNNNFSSSRFTPTVAGYYQLNAEVRLDGSSGTGEIMIVIWKNGAEYKRGTNQSGTSIATNFFAMTVSSLVYANGTTDYFEIYVQQTSGGSLTVTAVNAVNITWFNGCMIRGA